MGLYIGNTLIPNAKVGVFSSTGSTAVLQTKTVSPSETEQTYSPNTGFDGFSAFTVQAIPSNFVGSAIVKNNASSLSVVDNTVYVPAGYYAASAAKSITSGSVGIPTASKSAVNNHAITITPSTTSIAGYIPSDTVTGSSVTVSASELVSVDKSITSNGTNIDVTNYKTVSVNVVGGGTTPSYSNAEDMYWGDVGGGPA